MIRKKNYIFAVVIAILGIITLSTESVFTQNIETDLQNGFTSARPELIVKHFDGDTKIIIKPESYSPTKDQAIKILNKFFKENPVVEYESKFNSGKSNSNFMIKILKTQNKSYRLTIFFTGSNEGRKIKLLRIEQENESTF